MFSHCVELKKRSHIAKLGDKPWGGIFVAPEATPLKSITVEPGFKLELLHSADVTEGTWISMAIDPQGRLIICPQYDGNLLRVTVSPKGVEQIERIDQPPIRGVNVDIRGIGYLSAARQREELFEAPKISFARRVLSLALSASRMVNGNFTPTAFCPPRHITIART